MRMTNTKDQNPFYKGNIKNVCNKLFKINLIIKSSRIKHSKCDTTFCTLQSNITV